MLPLLVFCALLPNERPTLRAGRLGEGFVLDGRLDEPEWVEADILRELTQVDPRQLEEPSERTELRVLVDAKRLVFGVRCFDSRPELIVARTTERDQGQGNDDRIKIILDPYFDGRSGYLFVVNPLGARYDALISRGGASENKNWDVIWEARTTSDAEGWTVEISIPIESLGFRRGARRWFFNVERHLQRNQEINRWASPSRNYHINQTIRAGVLDDLPDFDYGVGFAARPALVGKYARGSGHDLDATLDLAQRLAPELLLSLTFNTDFSETEVDSRQSNLTRFPLFFPEKRAFFLEGSDLFEFGLDRSADVLPFYSRRVGLVDGVPVPLDVAGKLSGRVDQTSVGALVARTGEEEGVAPAAEMGVLRLKQNFLEESYVGVLGSAGDPLDRDDAWTLGADAAYQTSTLLDDLNFRAGAYALASDREELEGDTSCGAYVGLPNDALDVALSWKRIGREFDPSLGFVPRAGVHRYRGHLAYRWRPSTAGVRSVSSSLEPAMVTGLDGHWESFALHWSVVDVELESGDGFGAHAQYAGDRPEDAFDVAPGTPVRPGSYTWYRWHPVLSTAPRRPLSASLQYDLGEYYDGRLTKLNVDGSLNANSLLTLTAGAERSAGELESGSFRRDLFYGRLRVNASPDVSLSALVQYDTDSRDLGLFSRFRWTMTPSSELFLVYTYDWLQDDGRLDPLAYDGALKAQYTFRF